MTKEWRGLPTTHPAPLAELLWTCSSPDAKIEQSKVFLGQLDIFRKQ